MVRNMVVRTPAGGTGLIPSQRTKIPCVRHHGQNEKKKLKIIFLFLGLDFCYGNPAPTPHPLPKP